MRGAALVGVGAHRPARREDNTAVSERTGSSDAWIRERSGIVTRGVAGDGESVVDMAVSAGNPDDPFTQMPGMATEDQLEALASSSGAEADALFVELMSAHHRGGIDMAKYAVDHAQNDEVVRMAADDADLSPSLAGSMLAEVRRLDEPDADRVVTRREEEVLQLIADGCSTGEVASGQVSIESIQSCSAERWSSQISSRWCSARRASSTELQLLKWLPGLSSSACQWSIWRVSWRRSAR